MSVLRRAAHEFLAVQKVIDDAHIEITEFRNTCKSALHCARKCRQAKADERIFEYVKIARCRVGAYTAVLCYIVVIHHFAIGNGGYFKKSLERRKIAHECLFLNLFFQIDIDICRKAASGVVSEIMRRQQT